MKNIKSPCAPHRYYKVKAKTMKPSFHFIYLWGGSLKNSNGWMQKILVRVPSIFNTFHLVFSRRIPASLFMMPKNCTVDGRFKSFLPYLLFLVLYVFLLRSAHVLPQVKGQCKVAIPLSTGFAMNRRWVMESTSVNGCKGRTAKATDGWYGLHRSHRGTRGDWNNSRIFGGRPSRRIRIWRHTERRLPTSKRRGLIVKFLFCIRYSWKTRFRRCLRTGRGQRQGQWPCSQA